MTVPWRERSVIPLPQVRGIMINIRRTTFAALGLSVCQVGHNSSIFLKLGENTILQGGAPWQVR